MGTRNLVHIPGQIEFVDAGKTADDALPVIDPGVLDTRRVVPTPFTRGVGPFYGIGSARPIPYGKFYPRRWGKEKNTYYSKQWNLLLTPKHMALTIACTRLLKEYVQNTGRPDLTTYPTTFYQLVENMGLDGSGRSYKEVRQYLMELRHTSYELMANIEVGGVPTRYNIGSKILSAAIPETDDKAPVIISMDPLFLKVAMEGVLATPVDQRELISIGSDPARMLYVFLKGQQDFYKGRRYRVYYDQLMECLGFDLVISKRRGRVLERAVNKLCKMGFIRDYNQKPSGERPGWVHFYPPLGTKAAGLPQRQSAQPAQPQPAQAGDELARQLQDAYNRQGWPGGDTAKPFMEAAKRLRAFAQMNIGRFADHRLCAIADRMPDKLPGFLVPMVIDALGAGRPVEHAGWVRQDKFWKEEFDAYMVAKQKMEPNHGPARPRGHHD